MSAKLPDHGCEEKRIPPAPNGVGEGSVHRSHRGTGERPVSGRLGRLIPARASVMFCILSLLFSTSYSSICICLVGSGQSASILKMPVANNLLYLKAIGTLRREYAALLDTLGWFEKTLSDTIGLQCRIRRRHAFTSSRSPCAVAFRWIQNERAGFNPKLVRAGFKIFQSSRTREFFKVSSPPQFQPKTCCDRVLPPC